MAEFLQRQLDYIFFFYGTAFLLLIPICLFLKRRSCRKLPWIWLIWFGALHGATEWLDLMALSLELGHTFDYFRLGMLLLSFVCLAEFGRAGTQILCGRGPGRWILAVMVALAGVGGLAGVAGLFAATRYALGFVGGIWAAVALFLTERAEPPGSRALLIGATGMVGYALTAGLVVPPAPFFPASWLNYDSFFALTSVPIQLIRGLIAVLISFSLCLFAQTCLGKNHHFLTWFRQLILGALTGLALLLIGGWGFTQHLGNIATQDKWGDYEQDAEMVGQLLRDKMLETDRVAKIMSGSPVIITALSIGTSQTILQANSVLDFCSQSLPESICYLMSRPGMTIATSNRQSPDSFLGTSYAFRPYFQQALKGSAGRYWARGVTSREIGYYASFPVRDDGGRIIGATVIKRAFAKMPAGVRQNDNSFIINQQGIVIMANRPEMVLRSLWPLSATEKQELLASRQFEDGAITPILARKPLNKSECLFQGKRQMVVMRPIPCEGCFVVIMGSIWPIAQARLLGISATLVLCLGLMGFLTSVVIMRESEEGFRQLFENAADILILHEKGRIIQVNQQASHRLGYTSEELSRMSIFEIEKGYSKEFLFNLWDSNGNTVTLSGIYRRKDGSTFPTEIRATEITYRGKTLRLAAARDVSERKQAEEALQAERQRLFKLLDGLQAYIYLHSRDHRLIYANQYFRERFGDPGDRPCYEVLHGRQESCEECLGERVFETGISEKREWTSNSGHTFQIYVYPFADVDGSPLVLEMGIDITERKRAEEALRTTQENYRILASQLLTDQEAERRLIARELHDDLTQRLAALAMEIEGMELQTPSPGGPDSARLKAIRDKIVKLSIDTHALSRRLHPSILEDLGLADAIESEIAAFRQREGIVVTYQNEGVPAGVSQDIALCIYRILQESLRNIGKHSQATKVNIFLAGEDNAIHLSIEDNGTGFDPDQVKKKGGLGLASMRERAYLVGGTFDLRSQPGKGTVIEVYVPLTRIML